MKIQNSNSNYVSTKERLQKLTELFNKKNFFAVIESEDIDHADSFLLSLMLRLKKTSDSEKTNKKVKEALEILKSKSAKYSKKFKIVRPSNKK